MTVWHDFNPQRISPERFYAIIEIPKGSKKKYELDQETGLIRLDRILFTSTHYPMNYGFVPKTLADDGDPLDVLVLCSEILDPLTEVECYPVGVEVMNAGMASRSARYGSVRNCSCRHFGPRPLSPCGTNSGTKLK